ncbi:methyltransferase domain-containing protein [Actinomadura atramentaria]|uniref:methyltransferase domain-containing protein n=1 Tax=Actinomadura atramentaria TaxID=1990 RepID=UPI000370F5E5|nr:methyltransferase domain-containing protein [Actinomadura atramentaria]
MLWQIAAAALARDVTVADVGWSRAVETTPRHEFVPHWWTPGVCLLPSRLPGAATPWRADSERSWRWVRGEAGAVGHAVVYHPDRGLVVRVGADHADRARATQRALDRAGFGRGGDVLVEGAATCTATAPRTLIRLFRAAGVHDTTRVLEIGTGTGYGTALLVARLGDRYVTTIDQDSDLLRAARDRLARFGRRPAMHVGDATTAIPDGTYDAIVSTVPVNPVPAVWLAALQPGGRLVTPVLSTHLVLTVTAHGDGTATGSLDVLTAGDRQGVGAFTDVPPRAAATAADRRHCQALIADGEHVGLSDVPAQPLAEDSHLFSTLGLAVPGVRVHHHRPGPAAPPAGVGATTCLTHPDGSWARAANTRQGTEVHQHGPRRLWHLLAHARADLDATGGVCPAHGATVRVTPDGALHLDRFARTPASNSAR